MAGKDLPDDADLSWLLHRAGLRLRGAIDALVVEHGLTGGLRDYIVLKVLLTDAPKTQVELGQIAGVDKTTLTSLLDRLERDGLVERRLDPENRRVRIPVATDAGRKLYAKIKAAQRAAESSVPGMSATELVTLRRLLARLDEACEAAGMTLSGSCV